MTIIGGCKNDFHLERGLINVGFMFLGETQIEIEENTKLV